MFVHVSDWDLCLVLGAERVSLGPRAGRSLRDRIFFAVVKDRP